MSLDLLLVNPTAGLIAATCEPLGLCFLAGYLQSQGHTVEIWDEALQGSCFKAIRKWKPLRVGVGGTTASAPRAYMIGQWCKRRGIPSIMGGPHASALSGEASAHFDWVVNGAGETSTNGMLNYPLTTVYHPDARGIPDTECQPYHNWPLARKYAKIVGHRWFFGQGQPVSTIITSRGCPYRCHYCHNSTAKQKPYYYSIEHTLMQTRQHVALVGAKKMFFIDDDFTANRERLVQLVPHLPKLPWACNARAGHIYADMAETLQMHGCTHVLFGFESGSQRVLDLMNRKATVDQSVKAIQACRKVGISAIGSFMVGYPGETAEDLKETERFILDQKPAFSGICWTVPMPGSALFNSLEKPCRDWKQYKLTGPNKHTYCNPAMEYREAVEWYNRLHKAANKLTVSVGFVAKSFARSPLKMTAYVLSHAHKIPEYIRRMKW